MANLGIAGFPQWPYAAGFRHMKWSARALRILASLTPYVSEICCSVQPALRSSIKVAYAGIPVVIFGSLQLAPI